MQMIGQVKGKETELRKGTNKLLRAERDKI